MTRHTDQVLLAHAQLHLLTRICSFLHFLLISVRPHVLIHTQFSHNRTHPSHQQYFFTFFLHCCATSLVSACMQRRIHGILVSLGPGGYLFLLATIFLLRCVIMFLALHRILVIVFQLN